MFKNVEKAYRTISTLTVTFFFRFIPDRDFIPNNIKQVSAACEGLCKWVRAMEVYDRVIKIVAPKKAKLEEAEAELALQMETLNAKRAQLQEVSRGFYLNMFNHSYQTNKKIFFFL